MRVSEARWRKMSQRIPADVERSSEGKSKKLDKKLRMTRDAVRRHEDGEGGKQVSRELSSSRSQRAL